MAKRILRHTDLQVYQRAHAAAQTIFEHSKRFPKEERYSLTDQIRRCSRSVCGNLAEAWRKRRYPNAFVCKLSDSEAEAAETQVWLQFAVDCKYIDRDAAAELYREYEAIIGMLVAMINRPEDWQL
ncbi:MAG TPA: four helix bundle protein [Pirellulaceae bacterium]|nr:four helix bundle protein [Pirellulaceae bacterium]